jgi:serine O-acetyltransferase
MSGNLKDLIGLILESYRTEPDIIKIEPKSPINHNLIIEIIDRLRELIFVGFFGRKHLKEDLLEYYVGELLEEISYNLEKQIARAIRRRENAPGDGEAAALTYKFLAEIPSIRAMLATDVKAALDGDPAAFSCDEVILSYPGLYAVMVYRAAHELYKLDVPLIPRMMSEYAHEKTGIDIHPGARIGHHFFIDHGTGIVIGETTEIGNYVKIYQGVTLGALSTQSGQLLRGVKRHPTIEGHVVIYSGASILGGGTVIGEGTVIGSNTFITKGVPEKTRVSVKNPELQFRNNDGKSAVLELEQDESWYYMI